MSHSIYCQAFDSIETLPIPSIVTKDEMKMIIALTELLENHDEQNHGELVPGLYPSYYCSMPNAPPSQRCLNSSNPPGPSMPGKTSPTAPQKMDCQDGVNRSTCHLPAPCHRGHQEGSSIDRVVLSENI